MAKLKTSFYCQNCGNQSATWLGKCPQCNAWNTFVEEVIQRNDSGAAASYLKTERSARPVAVTAINLSEEARLSSANLELDRVLGGGIVAGSLILIGGEPGIGKSTLMLQVALQMKGTRILYITGEESEQQIKMRADRLGSLHPDCYILTETLTGNIFQQIEQIKPQVLVVDSIQTLSTQSIDSSAGSISQIRECAAELQRFAKFSQVPVFLIGHITKEGTLAGPKILEHMVDTVLQFEGDRNHGYRILRSVKNRFGSTAELGIYEMQGNGLREVSNPSEILLSQRDENLSGIAIAAMVEGLRPLLVEIQALVSTAAFGTPQRSATGFDLRRLAMLLAVLEKRCGFRLAQKDVFLNIAGGLRVDDPAIDLAVVSAVLSSSENLVIDPKICLAAEVGLSGEIRPVTRIEQRISEAEKLGFEQMIVSAYNTKGISPSGKGMRIIPVKKIEDVFRLLFG